jgi:hypothetical protein
MVRRLALVFAAALLSAAVAPPSTSADSYSFGSDQDEGGGFGWAIISGGSSSMSEMQDLDSIDDLKARFGDNFLYVREGHDRYVIKDRKLVSRAQEAAKEIGKFGREIGDLARAQARVAVDESLEARRQAKMMRIQKRLEREIDRRARRGEPTRDLERALDDVTSEIGSFEPPDRGDRLTASDRRDLTRRREEASERLHQGVRQIKREMREILREAKSRGLAERLDR